MKFGPKCFFTLLFISAFLWLNAQKVDSTILFSSTKSEEMFGLKQSSQKTDTVLDNIQNYYPTNLLGNIGLPSYSLLAKETNSFSGFFNWTNLSNNSNDLFTDRQPLYFSPTGKVYTKIFAAMGQKQEQVFKIQHSQNIKRLNISLLFNRYSCFGFYNFQKAITDNLLFSTHYTTKNGRWGFNSHFIFNKLKYQLNGGIQSDTLLALNPFADKQLLPVILSASKQNLRTSSFSFSTFFRLNKNDTLKASHYLIYEGNYQSNYWLNADGMADTAYYKHNYFYNSTLGNIDSASVKSFSNSFLYRLNLSDNKIVFYAGYKSEFSHYIQANIDTLSLNHIARAGLSVNLKNQLFTTNVQYVASGYNRNNYFADANYFLKLGKSFYFDVKGSASRQMPTLSSERYFSAHFIWNNSFSDIVTQNATATFGSTKYKFTIGAFAQQQQNLVYFDTLALPQQYKGNVLITRVFIQKDLKLWRIHFNNVVNYQQTGNTNLVRLPNILTFSQLYYEAKLFKNNLWLQVGIQARFVSAYNANAYMPATNQFYFQDKKNYGDYIFADFFINAQIDRFRFFIMAQHVNQGLMGSNYILVPNNPIADRSFKAGLVWMFFD